MYTLTGIIVEVKLRKSVLLRFLGGLFGFIFAAGRLLFRWSLGSSSSCWCIRVLLGYRADIQRKRQAYHILMFVR